MSAPLEIFCCYARKDQEMLEHLKKHLMPLQRQGLVTLWSDTDLNAGDTWEKVLHQHLESADLILLLISPDFMSSDYCYSIEMGRAIERHDQGSAIVIPILLRPIHWGNAPFAKLQMVPTNATPVTKWSDHDDAFYNITTQIDRIVSELQTRRAQIKVDGYNKEQQQRVVWQPTPAQDVFRVPAFDPAKLTLLRTLTGHRDFIPGMAISPDSKTLASHNYRYSINDQNYRYTIKLWELPSGRELDTLIGHTDFIYGMAISPDSKTLASCSADYTIRLWELPSGQALRTIGHRSEVVNVAISPDGTILASCIDNTVILWGLPFGREPLILTGHTDFIYGMAISPDSTILASGSDDSTIKLWELSSGRELDTLIGHIGIVRSVAISPDGTILASCSNDKTIKLWELLSGRELRTLTGHKRAVRSVAISPDGTILASCGDDGTIKLWG